MHLAHPLCVSDGQGKKNILKVIQPLFLDELRAEFDRLKNRKDNSRRVELQRFQKRLGELTFFDPACGCGNFLIIAYRELRTLEIDVIRELRAYRAHEDQQELDASELSVVGITEVFSKIPNLFRAMTIVKKYLKRLMNYHYSEKLFLKYYIICP